MDESLSKKAFPDKMREYETELDRVRQLLDMAFANGSRPSSATEDRVIFPLLVGCRDIVEEILFAANGGFGKAALRGVRTLYECVVVARFLNLHPEKSNDYLAQFHIQWAKIMQSIPLEHRDKGHHADLATKVPKYAKGKPLGLKDLNWSGKYTLEMAREAGKLANLHSVAFDYASAFVHPSAVLLLSVLSLRGDKTIETSVRSQDIESEIAVRTAHDLILNAVNLRLHYARADAMQELLRSCEEDFVRIWGYEPNY